MVIDSMKQSLSTTGIAFIDLNQAFVIYLQKQKKEISVWFEHLDIHSESVKSFQCVSSVGHPYKTVTSGAIVFGKKKSISTNQSVYCPVCRCLIYSNALTAIIGSSDWEYKKQYFSLQSIDRMNVLFLNSFDNHFSKKTLFNFATHRT